MTTARSCLAILGGSFDPVHAGHLAIGEFVCRTLQPTQLRLVPTGMSRQKLAARAMPEHRIAMLSLAFRERVGQVRLVIDDQEIRRAEVGIASYSVDTLANLRYEYGADAALVLVIGADQLLQLQTWKNWEQLFDLAHILVMSRPGATLDNLDDRVAYEFGRRTKALTEFKNSPAGFTFLCDTLDIDMSSTRIRDQLATQTKPAAVPPDVLDYILQHHLYQGTA